MKPEEYLNRTRAPEPAPFLRRNVLNEAERAWRESPRRRIRELTFHPLAAAASVLLALGIAWVAGEIDSRMTASLAGGAPREHAVEERRHFAREGDAPRLRDWLLDDEVAAAYAWNGARTRFDRPHSDEPEPR